MHLTNVRIQGEKHFTVVSFEDESLLISSAV